MLNQEIVMLKFGRNWDMKSKENNIWVFASSCFGQVDKERFVNCAFESLRDAAEYYHKEDGYFSLSSDLCVAPMPYNPTTEESKHISRNPYVLLAENGWASSHDVPMYDVMRMGDVETLGEEVRKYVVENGGGVV